MNTCDNANGYAYRGCNSCLVGRSLFIIYYILLVACNLLVLLSHNCFLLLAASYSITRLHREERLVLKQTTSTLVIARVTVNMLAKVYQIVLSIMFRVTNLKHATG